MYLINRCAISKKELQEGDDVVHFPYYDAMPSEPEFICCEDIALRSEFEKWQLRDRVIQKVRDFWIREYRDSVYFSILAENEIILISKSYVEDSIRLFFLKYVFDVWLTEDTWKRFQDFVTVEKGSIKLSEKESFSWNVDSAKGSVVLQKIEVRKDTIIVPITEWQNLQELLSTIR